MNPGPLLDFLARAETLRRDSFADLFFRGHRSDSPLRLTGLPGPALWVRLQPGAGNPLELEQVSIQDASEGAPGTPVPPLELQYSSLAPGFEDAMRQRLVFDNPGGRLGIATRSSPAEWIAFRLPRPLARFDLVIHARDDRWTHRAWGLAVEVSADGITWRRVHSQLERLVAFQNRFKAWLPDAGHDSPDDEALRAVGKILATIVQGSYAAARPLLEASPMPEPVRRQVTAALNAGILHDVQREWTSHGIQMSFRYWTPREKSDYLAAAVEVIAALRELSPLVSFGFGFVLGVLRSGDFIPHDDDIDVVVAFPHRAGQKLPDLLARIREHLGAKGYRIAGDHFNHVHVGRAGWPHVFDVFVGFAEDERVSWFPSARGNLALSQVFPTRDVTLHGVSCPFPAQPETYLEATYGARWREPDSHFMHPWDRKQYADLA
jgi:hypothetical protein